MSTQYAFANLCGVTYTGGNLLFTQQQSETDPESFDQILLSPVGNKINFFNLTTNIAQTLPFQNRSNIAQLCLSPDSKTLISIDRDGFSLIVNMQRKVVMAHFNFRDEVTAMAFSPDSKFFFVACGTKTKIFETPSDTKAFSPLVLYKKYGNLHSQKITGVTWSHDSRFIVTWSEDMTLKMISLHKLPGFLPFTFSGNKRAIIKVVFSQDDRRLFSISESGTMLLWRWSEDRSTESESVLKFQAFKTGKRLKTGDKPNEYVVQPSDIMLMTSLEKEASRGRFLLEKKSNFQVQGSSVITSAAIQESAQAGILVVGQSNGVFSVYNLDNLTPIHSFQIAQNKIDSVCINNKGEWIALGSREQGQLFVWEWKSETYVLKQQGHHFDLNTVAYSPEGTYLATGGDDGKLKLWTTKNCLNFVTFTEHTSKITALQFIPKKGNAVLSASLDGTVRAYDLVKYRNFRTLTTPKPAQFSCLAIEGTSGDIIAAGALDPFDVYIWSLRTSQLLEIFSSHTAPVSSVSFSPANAMSESGSILASSSWDMTVKVWDIFGRQGLLETLEHSSEVVTCEFHPTIKNELVSTTLGGQMFLWDAEEGQIKSFIECRADIQGGRLQGDRNTAAKSSKNKHFNSLTISPNGEFVIGGGNGKNICLYDLKHKVLLKRFAVTQNRSMDGVLHKLNSKNIKEGGVMQHEIDELDSDLEEDAWQTKDDLPGAKTTKNLIKRNVKLAIRVKCIKFSPDGTTFAAATTEGLIIYSNRLQNNMIFNPMMIDETVTLDNIISKVKDEQYVSGLALALRLNESHVTRTVYSCIPLSSVPLLCAHFPNNYLTKLLGFLAQEIETGRHVEWSMAWLQNILKFKGQYLQEQCGGMKSPLRALLLQIFSSAQFYDQSLARVVNQNLHMIDFIVARADQQEEHTAAQSGEK